MAIVGGVAVMVRVVIRNGETLADLRRVVADLREAAEGSPWLGLAAMADVVEESLADLEVEGKGKGGQDAT